MNALAPLDTLYELDRGHDLPLPAALAALYGRLRLPPHPGRPFVIGNFVTTLDGVVALDEHGGSGGGEISGFNRHDRAVMGLLRAVADAVIIGAGTLRADRDHVWTAGHVFAPLAEAYRTLRLALGKPQPPLNVVVTARGELDASLPVFQSGTVPVLIVTTAAGMERLHERDLPSSVTVRAVGGTGPLSARSILDVVRHVHASDIILVEGGPHLMGDFFAERCLDDLFLTLASQVAGRDGQAERPGLVAGQSFAPGHPRWGTLVGLKRADSHLFLRYAFEA